MGEVLRIRTLSYTKCLCKSPKRVTSISRLLRHPLSGLYEMVPFRGCTGSIVNPWVLGLYSGKCDTHVRGPNAIKWIFYHLLSEKFNNCYRRGLSHGKRPCQPNDLAAWPSSFVSFSLPIRLPSFSSRHLSFMVVSIHISLSLFDNWIHGEETGNFGASRVATQSSSGGSFV